MGIVFLQVCVYVCMCVDCIMYIGKRDIERKRHRERERDRRKENQSKSISRNSGQTVPCVNIWCVWDAFVLYDNVFVDEVYAYVCLSDSLFPRRDRGRSANGRGMILGTFPFSKNHVVTRQSLKITLSFCHQFWTLNTPPARLTSWRLWRIRCGPVAEDVLCETIMWDMRR